MDTRDENYLTGLQSAYQSCATATFPDALFRLLPQVVLTRRADERGWNVCNEDKLVSLLGYNAAEVKQWNDLLSPVHPDDLPAATEHLKKAYGLQAAEQLAFSCRLLSKRQDIKHVTICITPLDAAPDGMAASFLCMVENHTAQVALEHTITQLEAAQTKTDDLLSYKEMIDEREYFLNQGSWETILQTGETTWSKGMYHIFGYDTKAGMDQLKVTNTLHLSHLSEEEKERHLEEWKLALLEKQDYVREASIITINGEHKQVETYGKIIRNKDGVAEKVIGTTRDVTSLNQYKRSLEEKISELNHRNSDLEGFAYIASHDLQEPLRKLSAFSERLQTKFKQQLGEDGQLYLDRIVASTENMQMLIDSLLEFSRTARSNRLFSRHSLSDLLRATQSDLELKIEESGTRIEAGPLPMLDVNPSQIKQLFSNLLGNSIKFKKAEQAPVINVSCEMLPHPERKNHHLRNNKEYYKLLIKDNGIGFEKEYAERIFQIFQRLHGKHEYPGSGIGLAICKKIVENHNGLIYADAEPEKGAVFTIILPENQL